MRHERGWPMELAGLGVGPAEQQVYEVLLHHPDRTLAELTRLTGIGATRLRALLKSLAGKGLLTSTRHRPARYAPSPPDIALEVLALRRRQEIEHARLAGVAFRNRVRPQTPAALDTPVELVRGRPAVTLRFRQLQEMARRELLILDKPPYVVEPDGQQHLQRELQSRGVRYRTIYDRDALEPQRRLEQLRQLAAHGEEARVLPGVPMKLVIADHTVALAPHRLSGQDSSAILLRSSALLDGLVALFESLWEQATPLWPQHRWPPPLHDAATDPLSSKDQQLLALLAAGLTDQAIARKLGVALRTVERRVRRMMDGLGARTRFQAGLQAGLQTATRALLGSPEPDDSVSPGTP
ncbi:MAG TPA: helix-turn-helix domain-containing protein [Actinophytocola sp.]|uniref:helix-turn-helix domain-containing protein n=1 Tax=Actinophytocola sp. TaxID=1872138 RepID=UPI002DDDB2BE|nr:helix-turn-helix domain-containing protein [Actinophytocola sp.]HEV2781609.1 helix-turn-helix domain-containing protein [Actinophytocola sp.]